MGTLQSTLSAEQIAVSGGVAATLVVGALFYTAQAPPNQDEQPAAAASSSSTKKSKKKKSGKTSAVTDQQQPSASGTVTPPALAASERLFSAEKLEEALSQDEAQKPKTKKRKGKAGIVPGGGDFGSAQESGVESSAAEGASGSDAAAGPSSDEKKTKSKKKKSSAKAKSPLSQVAAPSSSSPVDPLTPQATLDASTNLGSSWTRVESRKGKGTPGFPPLGAVPTKEELSAEGGGSDAGVTTSVTEEEQDQSEDVSESSPGKPRGNAKTFAEKMLPKPRKTAVDDMLPEQPDLARVMRVTSGTPQKPPGVSWGDYEDADEMGDAEDDDGWGIVQSRKSRPPRAPTDSQSTVPSSMTSSASSIPGAPLTKHQKQNIAKREAQKAAKADAEADRLARLNKHKKELEKARIEEQYKKTGSGKKQVGGGMNSSVQGGALVWE